MYQIAFNAINAALAMEVLFAYLTYGEIFDIYTDASKQQLGAMITQNN